MEQRVATPAGLTAKVRERLLDQSHRLDLTAPDARSVVRDLIWQLIEEEEARNPLTLYTAAEKAAVLERIFLTVFGYGMLDPLLHDPEVTEIMINGPDTIFIERGHRVERAVDATGQPLRFESIRDLLYLIEKIVSPLNRKVDESDPIVDARLPDGSRVNVVLKPVALNGPTVTIRKFPHEPFSFEDLVRFGTLPPGMAELLRRLVKAKYSLIVSGGTGTGKTTFLNALGMAIAGNERVVTVEDAAELKLVHLTNLVSLETRPPNIEAKGAITMRDLVRTALRMRPDRIIVGEVRGGEALDMLQAMNTGHEGSLTTAHANSAQDLLSRLETMVLMAGLELPVSAIRRQIAGALDFVVHLSRMPDGSRRVVQLSEVRDVRRSGIVLNDIFHWDDELPTPSWVWTGQEIANLEKFRRAGVQPVDLMEVL